MATQKGSGLNKIIGAVRQVGATSQSDYSYMLQQAAGATNEAPFRPGTRYIIEGGRLVPYDGPGIVSRDGRLIREGYYTESDVYSAYSVSPAARQTLLKKLVAADFLDKNSIGDFNSELNAIEKWLNFSNTLGIERDWALDQRLSEGPMIGRGGGGATRTYRTSNAQDLVLAAKAVAKDTIGREISDAEAQQFASAYQQQEVAYQQRVAGGGTVQDPMSLETSAQSFVQNIAPKETAAYGYLGYMNKLFNMIGVQ